MACRILEPELRAMAQGPGLAGRFGRQPLRVAVAAGVALALPGANGAGRAARGADGGAKVEQGLGEVGSPRLCGRVSAQQGGGGVDAGARRRERVGDVEDAGGDALDVAVDGHDRHAEGDAGDGGCGVTANAGQCLQAGHVAREGSGRCDQLGAGVQVAGAGVVAEACPGLHHGLGRCCG